MEDLRISNRGRSVAGRLHIEESMEVWTIIRNEDCDLKIPVRITVSGTLDDARMVKTAVEDFINCGGLYQIVGEP